MTARKNALWLPLLLAACAALLVAADSMPTDFGKDGEKFLKAAFDGDLETVRAMLKASPGIVNSRGGQKKQSALHHAAYTANLDLARLLIENGADQNYKNTNGFTPFDLAIFALRQEREKSSVASTNKEKPALKPSDFDPFLLLSKNPDAAALRKKLEEYIGRKVFWQTQVRNIFPDSERGGVYWVSLGKSASSSGRYTSSGSFSGDEIRGMTGPPEKKTMRDLILRVEIPERSVEAYQRGMDYNLLKPIKTVIVDGEKIVLLF